VARPSVVLDSNVWISGTLWTGVPHRIVRMIEHAEARASATSSMLDELQEALARPKFAARFHELKSSPSEIMDALVSLVTIVADVNIAPVVRDDPDDDKVLACAVSAEADYLITGDSHLLKLGSFASIPIVTPADFIRGLAGRPQR
jgi:putative PIN family toxin of toxin-antitoxin system